MSLMNSETEGLAALIQYNPHGVFLALEELGYMIMSLPFLFMALGLPTEIGWNRRCGGSSSQPLSWQWLL